MAAEKSQDFQKTVARLARKAIGQDFSRALRWANERGYTVMGSIAWCSMVAGKSSNNFKFS